MYTRFLLALQEMFPSPLVLEVSGVTELHVSLEPIGADTELRPFLYVPVYQRAFTKNTGTS